MNGPNDYDYLDNFDDNRDIREYRRRHRPVQNRPAQPNSGARRPQGTAARRPSSARGGGSYPPNRRPSAGPSKKRNNRRIRNRIIIVALAIIVLSVFMLVLSSAFGSCSNKSEMLATVSTDTIAPTETTAAKTEDASNTSSQSDDLSPTNFVTPDIDDDNTSGTSAYSIYVWHNTGYELFGSDDARAQTYAETVNSLADKLGSDIKVYDMMIPNHTEMGLPQRLKDEAGSSSQADNIKAAYAALADNVTAVNCYNYLANHNSEYIYFKSDHHWTALGAYYAYKAFAETNNLSVLSLDDCTENKIEGFTGSFSNTVSGLDEDTVSYYTLPYDVSMDVTSSSGDTVTYESPYYSAATGGVNTYGVFIVGDNPLTVLKSSSENAGEGKKIAVIKESYGNALVPFLTNNYQEVHVIDFRYFDQNLVDYCKTNSISEVLFLNGVMSANTQTQLDSMTSLFD